ncbi:MAG TPA: hypothetical protein DCP91_03145 [Eggerthellaceae bacterium]|nr:hypothetical protein [Eggerthellaceae bacterium]
MKDRVALKRAPICMPDCAAVAAASPETAYLWRLCKLGHVAQKFDRACTLRLAFELPATSCDMAKRFYKICKNDIFSR